jgi:hypothetical protein
VSQSPTNPEQRPASETSNADKLHVATAESTNDAPIEPASKPADVETVNNEPPARPVATPSNTITNDLRPPAAVAVSAPDDLPSVPPAAETVASDDARRAPVLKIDPLDPLDFDPAKLMLPAPGSTNSASIASAAASATPGEAASAAGESGNSLPAKAKPPAAPNEDPTITVRRGPPSAEPPQPRAVASQLALPINSLSMRAVPLMKIVDTLSDMSGVPITLDPAALELTGGSPRREATMDAKDTTIERLFRNVLSQQRLDFVEQDGRLIVVSPTADTQRPRDYDVADLLIAGETNAARLAGRILRFIAPESWEAVGGVGTIAVNGTTLHVEQTDRVHIGILLFCERLRVARGLAPKSRYPVERLVADSPYGRLAAKLNQPTTFTFVPWTRLADVVRDWRERSGVTMLVDWQALAQVELGPSSPVSCSALQRTWEDALDGILAPLGLSWWAVDGDTIQITSRTAVERMRRVEFFAIPQKLREQFAGDAALVESLQTELREHAKAADGGLVMDVDGQHLIVSASDVAHRYLTQRLARESGAAVSAVSSR